MVTKIKKGASVSEIKGSYQKLFNHSSKRKFDAYKFCGTVKFEEDGLSIQKKLRDEW